MTDLTLLLRARDEASKVIRGLKGRLAKLNDTAKSVANQGMETLNKGFEKAKIAILALGAGAVALGVNVIKMGALAETAGAFWGETFKTMDKEASKFAKNYAKTVGRSEFETRRMLAGTADLGIGFGMMESQALDFGKSVMQVTGDLASFRDGLSDQEAYQLMISSLQGNHTAAVRLGAVLNENTLLETMRAKGLKKSWKELTEQEKIQVRLETIMRQNENAMGDAARTADETNNVFKTLRGIFIDFQVAIGERVIPIVNRLAIRFRDLLRGIDIEKVLDKVENKFKSFIQSIKPVIDLFNRFNKEGELTNSIIAGIAGVGLTLLIGGFVLLAKTVALATWPFVVLGIIIGGLWYAWEKNFLGIQDITKEVFGYIQSTLLPGVIAFFENLMIKIKEMGGIKNAIKTVFLNLKDNVINTFEEIKTKIVDTVGVVVSFFEDNFGPTIDFIVTVITELKVIWETIVYTFQSFVVPILMILAAVLIWLGANVIQGLIYAWEKLQEPVMGFLSAIMELISPLVQILLPIIGVIGVALIGLGGIILTVLTPVFNSLWALIVNIFSGILKVITGVIQIITGILNIFIGVVIGIFTGDFSQAVKGFKQLWNGLVKFVEGAIQLVLSPLTSLIDGIMNAFNSINLIQAGKNMIESLIRGIKNMAGAVGDAIKSILPSSIPGIGDIKIPGFAVGTRHHQGGLALVGERGPELVNMPAGSKVDTATATERKANQSSGNVIQFSPTINFNSVETPSGAKAKEMYDNLKEVFENFLDDYNLKQA